MAATDQIRQMVNFILQEAHEKANEIRVKVCRAFPVFGILKIFLFHRLEEGGVSMRKLLLEKDLVNMLFGVI